MNLLGVQETPAGRVDRERLPRGVRVRVATSEKRKIQTNKEDGEGISGGGNSMAKMQRRWAPG